MNNDSDNKELTIINILKLLWKDKFVIVSITLLFSVSAVFYSLSIQNYYTSTALLASTSSDSSAQSSMLSNMGGLASLAGIQLPQSSGDKTDISITMMKSRQFFEHLVNKDPLILPSLMAPLEFDKNDNVLIFDPEQYIANEDKWIRGVKEPYQVIPSIQESHKIFLNNFSIKKDDQTGFVDVSFQHISPYFAEYFLTLIVDEINEITRFKDLNDSKSAISYLEEESSKNSNRNIENSINALMQAEMEKQMLSQISQYYVFEYIDKPFVPELKSGPNRAIICIVSFFAGLLIACFYSLFKFNFRPRVYN